MLSELLSLMIQARIPTFLLSSPGQGKTSIVQGIARELALPCLTYILSIREAVDVSGLPKQIGEEFSYLPNRELSRLARHAHGVLFLDELTSAWPDVQAAALRIVEERYAGELYLGNISIVAAGNPPELAANGQRLAAALANRFLFLQWTLNFDEWSEYVSGRGAGAVKIVPLPQDWEENIPVWGAYVAGFLRARPDFFAPVPKAGELAFPSPRSWTRLAQACAAVDTARMGHDALSIVANGAVGAVGTEFITWLAKADLPPISELLDNPALLPADSLQAVLTIQAMIAWPGTDYERAINVLAYATRAGHKAAVATVLSAIVKMALRENKQIPDFIVHEYGNNF